MRELEESSGEDKMLVFKSSEKKLPTLTTQAVSSEHRVEE